MSNTFNELQEIIKKLSYYVHVSEVMYWDMRTVMPQGGFDDRMNTLAFMETERFKLGTSEELKKILDTLSKEEEFRALSPNRQYIVKRMKRDLDENARIPVEFVGRFSEASSKSERAWEEAKRANDFAIFAPHLEEMISLVKERAGYTHPGCEVLDVLLNEYEEGMTSDKIDPIFNELKEKLIPLVRKIGEKETARNSVVSGSFDIEAQKKVQDLLLEYIGFNSDKGCTGETEHPFTLNICDGDVRVSNHFHEDEPIGPMFSAIHEGGHAIFEQNVDHELNCTVGGSCSYYGIHESQSRFYENILGRNINFWKPIYGKIQALLPQFEKIPLSQFERIINRVTPSFIRTDADEVTYCFHIILRYEMEKAIFRDNVPVSELPLLWNKKMEEYLGITPRSDAEGILQDMHWSDGSFGYFPSYLLGSIYDGMYLDAITEELGDVDKILSEGRIKEITKWLNEKIHRFGSTRLPADVIENVCGKPLSAEPLVRYFTEKYTRIYDL